MEKIRDFFRRIKRVADFLPIVWKGRDFDYRFAVELFNYQLERTADYLESDKAYTLSGPINAKKIRTAIELGDKVFDAGYSSEWVDIISEKYGKDALEFWFKDMGEGALYLQCNYESWENAEEIQDDIRRLEKICRERQEKAEDIYWRYLQHNIKKWWD